MSDAAATHGERAGCAYIHATATGSRCIAGDTAPVHDEAAFFCACIHAATIVRSRVAGDTASVHDKAAVYTYLHAAAFLSVCVSDYTFVLPTAVTVAERKSSILRYRNSIFLSLHRDTVAVQAEIYIIRTSPSVGETH